jgi:ABC-type nitrate/sulfonate/bicarbonate transport system substrate-binding protein
MRQRHSTRIAIFSDVSTALNSPRIIFMLAHSTRNGLKTMNILLRLAQAVGFSLALSAAALADEPLKIATSAGPVGQLASFAAKLAKEKGQDVKIVELSDWVALNEVVNSGDVDANLFQTGPIWRFRTSSAGSTSFRSTRSG